MPLSPEGTAAIFQTRAHLETSNRRANLRTVLSTVPVVVAVVPKAAAVLLAVQGKKEKALQQPVNVGACATRRTSALRIKAWNFRKVVFRPSNLMREIVVVRWLRRIIKASRPLVPEGCNGSGQRPGHLIDEHQRKKNLLAQEVVLLAVVSLDQAYVVLLAGLEEGLLGRRLLLCKLCRSPGSRARRRSPSADDSRDTADDDDDDDDDGLSSPVRQLNNQDHHDLIIPVLDAQASHLASPAPAPTDTRHVRAAGRQRCWRP